MSSIERHLYPKRKRHFLSQLSPDLRPKDVIVLRPDQSPSDYIAEELAKLGVAPAKIQENPEVPL
jgi:hypothetical protein